MYDINIFKPIWLNDLTRVGKDNDGGYVINERTIPITINLIGLGICYDWSFEEGFKKRNPSVHIFGFDGHVGSNIHSAKDVFALRKKNILKYLISIPKKCLRLIYRFWRNRKLHSFFSQPNNHFYSRFVSKAPLKRHISFNDVIHIIAQHSTLAANSCFLKMDIESAEFDILPDILNHSQYINGMAVEFHDLDTQWHKFVSLLNQIKEMYYITHAHGNNCCGAVSKGGLPRVLELTFLKKDIVDSNEIGENTQTYPIARLDSPNLVEKSELSLMFT